MLGWGEKEDRTKGRVVTTWGRGKHVDQKGQQQGVLDRIAVSEEVGQQVQ
jgi:hypothetical protein